MIKRHEALALYNSERKRGDPGWVDLGLTQLGKMLLDAYLLQYVNAEKARMVKLETELE